MVGARRSTRQNQESGIAHVDTYSRENGNGELQENREHLGQEQAEVLDVKVEPTTTQQSRSTRKRVLEEDDRKEQQEQTAVIAANADKFTSKRTRRLTIDPAASPNPSSPIPPSTTTRKRGASYASSPPVTPQEKQEIGTRKGTSRRQAKSCDFEDEGESGTEIDQTNTGTDEDALMQTSISRRASTRPRRSVMETPKASIKEEDVEDDNEAVKSVSKRGRPKGSKNKPKRVMDSGEDEDFLADELGSADDYDLENGDNDDEYDEVTRSASKKGKAKGKRGRPKKNPDGIPSLGAPGFWQRRSNETGYDGISAAVAGWPRESADPLLARLLGQYAFFRSFSQQLFLSPFTLNAYLVAVKSNLPTNLLDELFIAALKILAFNACPAQFAPSQPGDYQRSLLEDHEIPSGSPGERHSYLALLAGFGSADIFNQHYAYFADHASWPPKRMWSFLDRLTWQDYLRRFLVSRVSLQPFRYVEWMISVVSALRRGEFCMMDLAMKCDLMELIIDELSESEMLRLEFSQRERDRDARDPRDSIHIRNAIDLTRGHAKIEFINNDVCNLCGLVGTLVCCDSCPRSFHTKCISESSDRLPDQFICEECKIPMFGNVTTDIRIGALGKDAESNNPLWIPFGKPCAIHREDQAIVAFPSVYNQQLVNLLASQDEDLAEQLQRFLPVFEPGYQPAPRPADNPEAPFPVPRVEGFDGVLLIRDSYLALSYRNKYRLAGLKLFGRYGYFNQNLGGNTALNQRPFQWPVPTLSTVQSRKAIYYQPLETRVFPGYDPEDTKVVAWFKPPMANAGYLPDGSLFEQLWGPFRIFVAVKNQILNVENQLFPFAEGDWGVPGFRARWISKVRRAGTPRELAAYLLHFERSLRSLVFEEKWFGADEESPKLQFGMWWAGPRAVRNRRVSAPLARKGGRTHGCRKLPGMLYGPGNLVCQQSRQDAWRKRLLQAASLSAVAFEVRYLDLSIRWEEVKKDACIEESVSSAFRFSVFGTKPLPTEADRLFEEIVAAGGRRSRINMTDLKRTEELLAMTETTKRIRKQRINLAAFDQLDNPLIARRLSLDGGGSGPQTGEGTLYNMVNAGDIGMESLHGRIIGRRKASKFYDQIHADRMGQNYLALEGWSPHVFEYYIQVARDEYGREKHEDVWVKESALPVWVIRAYEERVRRNAEYRYSIKYAAVLQRQADASLLLADAHAHQESHASREPAKSKLIVSNAPATQENKSVQKAVVVHKKQRHLREEQLREKWARERKAIYHNLKLLLSSPGSYLVCKCSLCIPANAALLDLRNNQSITFANLSKVAQLYARSIECVACDRRFHTCMLESGPVIGEVFSYKYGPTEAEASTIPKFSMCIFVCMDCDRKQHMFDERPGGDIGCFVSEIAPPNDGDAVPPVDSNPASPRKALAIRSNQPTIWKLFLLCVLRRADLYKERFDPFATRVNEVTSSITEYRVDSLKGGRNICICNGCVTGESTRNCSMCHHSYHVGCLRALPEWVELEDTFTCPSCQLRQKYPIADSASEADVEGSSSSAAPGITCVVCRKGDDDKLSDLGQCCRCKMAVHGRCYSLGHPMALPFKPIFEHQCKIGDWKCNRCRFPGGQSFYTCPDNERSKARMLSPCVLCGKQGSGPFRLATKECARAVRDLEMQKYKEARMRKVGALEIDSLPAGDLAVLNPLDQSFDVALGVNSTGTVGSTDLSDSMMVATESNGGDTLLSLAAPASAASTTKPSLATEAKEPDYSIPVWAHLTCLLWTPECSFTWGGFVEGIDTILPSRADLPCSICMSTDGMSKVPCFAQGCTDSCHVFCGLASSGWAFFVNEGASAFDPSAFCPRHAYQAPLSYWEYVSSPVRNRNYEKTRASLSSMQKAIEDQSRLLEAQEIDALSSGTVQMQPPAQRESSQSLPKPMGAFPGSSAPPSTGKAARSSKPPMTTVSSKPKSNLGASGQPSAAVAKRALDAVLLTGKPLALIPVAAPAEQASCGIVQLPTAVSIAQTVKKVSQSGKAKVIKTSGKSLKLKEAFLVQQAAAKDAEKAAKKVAKEERAKKRLIKKQEKENLRKELSMSHTFAIPNGVRDTFAFTPDSLKYAGGWRPLTIHLIKQLMKEKEASSFNVKVDWKVMGIPDYPRIVKKPVDFGAVLEKLEADEAVGLKAVELKGASGSSKTKKSATKSSPDITAMPKEDGPHARKREPSKQAFDELNYPSLIHVSLDIELIFINCFRYNGHVWDSPIMGDMRALLAKWQAMWTAHFGNEFYFRRVASRCLMNRTLNTHEDQRIPQYVEKLLYRVQAPYLASSSPLWEQIMAECKANKESLALESLEDLRVNLVKFVVSVEPREVADRAVKRLFESVWRNSGCATASERCLFGKPHTQPFRDPLDFVPPGVDTKKQVLEGHEEESSHSAVQSKKAKASEVLESLGIEGILERLVDEHDADFKEDSADAWPVLIPEILKELERMEDAEPFLEPVKGIKGYSDVVKNPMDLSTIRRKLSMPGKYKDRSEVAADFDLILSNCILFNGSDPEASWIVASGLAMYRKYQELWIQKGLGKVIARKGFIERKRRELLEDSDAAKLGRLGKDAVGASVELFSEEQNSLVSVEIVSYDDWSGIHYVKHSDGFVEGLSLVSEDRLRVVSLPNEETETRFKKMKPWVLPGSQKALQFQEATQADTRPKKKDKTKASDKNSKPSVKGTAINKGEKKRGRPRKDDVPVKKVSLKLSPRSESLESVAGRGSLKLVIKPPSSKEAATEVTKKGGKKRKFPEAASLSARGNLESTAEVPGRKKLKIKVKAVSPEAGASAIAAAVSHEPQAQAKASTKAKARVGAAAERGHGRDLPSTSGATGNEAADEKPPEGSASDKDVTLVSLLASDPTPSHMTDEDKALLASSMFEHILAMGSRAIGRRVEVYWWLDKKWYPGEILACKTRKRQLDVLYDEGEELPLAPEEEPIRLLS